MRKERDEAQKERGCMDVFRACMIRCPRGQRQNDRRLDLIIDATYTFAITDIGTSSDQRWG